MPRLLVLALCLAFSPAPVRGQETLSPAADEVLLFKSGQAFLQRGVPLPAGEVALRLELPRGLHGTVWLGSSSHQVASAIATTAETTMTDDVVDLTGALRAALGQAVALEVAGGQSIDRRSGTLTRLIGPVARLAAGAVPQPTPPSAAVLSDESGDHVVPLARIVGLQLRGEARRAADEPWTYAATVERPVLDVELAAGAESRGEPALVLSHMANGLAWAPSYVLTLGEAGVARLVGKAVIVNDLEDLRETRVRLVVGYPNIQFAGVPSALLPEMTLARLRELLNAAARGQSGADAALSNVWMAQRAVVVGSNMVFEGAGALPEVAGEAAEDLYIYDAGVLSLQKGQRAYVPLVSRDVEVEHRFDWELPDKVDEHARFREASEDTPVWHVLEVTNERDAASAPWTTAPVLITNDQGPLAQSTLNYTPAGADTVVRLTQALNLVGQALEYRADDAEADREEIRLFGNRYERVHVRGQLELTNHGARTAPMKVQKQLSGDVLSAEGEPGIRGRAKSLGRVNASRVLSWEFTLDPGETWKADYEYRVLIRR